MAPPVWTLMLLVGAAWGQDQVPAPVCSTFSSQIIVPPASILSECDFEDNSRPLCDWSQMSADDGDWVRTTGPFPTGTSGPPGGYPSGKGYYLRMDSRAFPRGGVVRLRSPDIWEQGPLCVHFAFHMFGLSWGAQLRLLLLRGRKHHRPYVLWKHVNTQSPSWVPTTVTIPADRDIPSSLMFEGMRGNTAYLDISLDGLSIRRGTCNRVCMTQMCNFDTLNNLCGWSWVPTATGAKWTQKKGSSGVPGVGPDDDFSRPGSGYYMLLDSTDGRPGQKAVLLSPLSHSSGCLTLSFHYIMRGKSPGEGMFVYATFLGNIRKHTLFSGHHGHNWQAVSVNYTGQGQIQFLVVGVFGEQPEPAIAVDAISISPCGESLPQCSFEDKVRPFCDWSHVYGDMGHWSWGSKSVPTPISGPPREFPYGGEHYIYFDSVKLSQEGQSARLVSPPFCAPGDICVEFAYHMFGLGQGTMLKLLLGSPAGSAPVSLWNRVGSQSSGWLNSSVTIPKGHQQPMQLFLEAIRGTSTAFVVAVNFILISHRQCRVLPQAEASSSPLAPPTGPSETTVSMLPIEQPATPTEETTVPTEVTTVPTEVTTVPTETITVPTEVTTVPTETTTIPTEETTVPTETTTIPTEVTTVPTETITVPTEEATVPTEGITVTIETNTIPTEETTVPPEGITVTIETTIVPTEEITVPTEVTTVTIETTTVPPEVTTVPTETTTAPTEETTVPSEETTTPTEVTTVPPEETTILTEVTTVRAEETTVPTEETTVPTEETTVPTEETTVPTEETTVPTEVTTAFIQVTTVPTEVTNIHIEITTLSPEETSISPEETTSPMEVSTVPPASVAPEETTTPTEVTTVSPKETRIPPEETTNPPEETTASTEETTASTEETTETTASTEETTETTASTEETTASSEETTETTASTEETTETTASTEETTVITEQSTDLTQMSAACKPPCPSPPFFPIEPSPSQVLESCPLNAHHEPCGCPASCENPKPSCKSPCHPGCVCNPGFLFSNNQCVNASSCDCLYSNKYYKPGEEWFTPNCMERCRCLPGSLMECQISQCGTHTVCRLRNEQYKCEPYGTATCMAYGDLHFVTFDERHVSFMGTCTYILTQTCDNSTDLFFRITAKIQERGVEGVSCLDKVFVTLPEITVTLMRGRHTLIEDQEVTLPVIPANGIYVGLSGRFVELRTTFGLRVRWDGDQQLFVTVSSAYSGKLCGVCGNYDGDGSNDNLKPDNTMAQDEEELGKSWQMEDEESKDPADCFGWVSSRYQKTMSPPPSCDPALRSTLSGPKFCGQLVDPKGPFESCLLHLQASSFLDNCVSDMCSFQGLQQKLCAHMSAMTATCQDAGYAVKSWRGPQFCSLACPQNSKYSLCAKPCPDTCHPGSASQPCTDQCVESCECDPGFILSGSECVPRSQCGCTSLEGRYFKIQEQWFNPDCKEICTCEDNNSIRCQPWKCKAQEVCSHQNGVLGCHAQGAATCIASGDPHYLTFDGALHHFMGTCTYVLTQPCWSNSQDNNFVVSATNEIQGGNLEVSYVKAVHVQVFDLKISLLKGRKVVLNNQRVALPVWPSKGRVTIRLSGIFVLLYTNFGLQVRYDGNQLVEVTVPSSYTGSLCGLCGNYNNDSLDDNLRPDRKPTGNSLLLGAAWKILEASEPGCFLEGAKSSSCKENSMDDAWTKKCAILMNPVGPFSGCHEAVPPQASFSSCVYSQCGTKGDNLALCRSLQAYASLCAQAGQVTTWRNSTFCPLRCPPRSSYNPCADPCPATCLTLSTPRDCPTLPCFEGCECQRGHILSGTTCVPLRHCGCSDQEGSYHMLGESWYTEKTCTTICTCSVHGNIACNQTACEANHVCLRQDGRLRCAAEIGECHISEDSQIVSFDGYSHPIQDMCTYIMVKVCHPNMNLPFFTISAKTEQNTRSKSKTFGVYQLYIEIFSFHVTLQKDHSVLVRWINDTLVTLPATTQIPGVSITTEDVYTIVTIKDEVQVKFESNNFLDIKIPASSNGKVCGVCGNFNGEEEDELMMPSDELAEDEQEFMNSWEDKSIYPTCQRMEEQNIQVKPQEIMNGKCRPSDFEKAQANCQRALLSPVWAQCASQVPLKPFLLGCMNSFCEFRELFRALCESLQSFGDACLNQGLAPPIWRNSSFCPLECPDHSYYTNCLPSCPPSCLDPDSLCEGSSHKVPTTCKEGCTCHPGYVLNNDKCVLKTHCGCKDAQGVFVPEGKSWISSSCTQNCICIGGTIECQNFHCPSGAQCQDNEDGSSNCVKITLQCPAHSRYSNCLPPCLPSCSNLDGGCKGTSPKVPSACQEGCLCHDGFVLDKDKCVPRIHCGCKDTQGAFIPAGKTWMSTGCTQSCTCMRGTIRCQAFQCPSGTYCRDNSDGSSNCVKLILECPAHSQFTDCLPHCQPSCSDPDARCEGISTRAPSSCKEGCVCRPGYVLHKDKCVLRMECGCQDAHGVFIPVSWCHHHPSFLTFFLFPWLLQAGKSWTSRGCSLSCNCMEGVIQCQKFQCPSGTYCQDIEDGTSNCAKITLQCPAHSRHTNCLPSCQPSCSDPEGHCGGSSTKAPSTCKEGCVCRPGFVLHKDKCVLRILCGCKDAQGVLIPADKTWVNRGCTQTCTCMAGTIHCRSFQCPSGTYCKDIEDGNSNCTKITLQCPAHSRFTNCLPSCLPSCSNLNGHCEASSTKVPSSCKEGCLCQPGFVFHEDKCVPRVQCGCKDIQGTFIPAGKTWISRGCTQSCTCVGGAVQCQNFQCPQGTYCRDSNDSSSNCTEITLQCPAHSLYTSCLPSCLPSCSDPEGLCMGTSRNAPFTCKEGCVCQSGYVLNSDKCMLRTQCGCKDAQGVLIPPDKTWINRGCTQSCTCVAGAIQCRSFQCPSRTYCKDTEDGNSNCTKITMHCPAHSRHTNCLPSCRPSCSDPEGLCGGTSPRPPSTCKEGCVCRPGFVLHNNKCVLRILCSCKDAQGALIPADKTWLSRGCTQSCTCVAGTIHCKNFQCPSGTYCKDMKDGNSNCTKTTLQCPSHSQFTDCLPSCPPSCSNRCEVTSPKVPSMCKVGCLCDHGFVFSEDKCVPRSQCACQDARGGLIPAGKTWTSRGCMQNCACMEGNIQCQNFQCPLGTYCKDNSDDSSTCTKTTLQCPAHSHYTGCLPSCQPSCLDPEGLCKGTSPEVPTTCKEGCVCQPGYLLSNDKCVLRTECGCKDSQGILIPAGKTWTSIGCTQNCACMGGAIQCQNFQCPSGTYCKNNNDGSNSCAKIILQCPTHSLFASCLPSCLPSCLDPDGLCKGTSHKVPSTCKEGCICQPGFVLHNDKCILRTLCGCKDAQDTLIPEGKTWVSRDCTQSCACTGGTIQCLNFQCPQGTYCKNSDDGISVCAETTLQCPANSHYTDCFPSCPPSCLDPEGHCGGTGSKVPSTCKEGCLCHQGFVLDKGKCVPRIQCGCKGTQGALIPAGKTWAPRGCTQSCTCVGGAVQCQNFQCPSGTYCKDNNDGSSHCAKTTLQCPAHSHFTSCLPSCPPSCFDLDGHCEKTNPKVPSTCKMGCVCQPGYFLNNDKCVLQVHCDCKDAQGGLIPAGKTWTSRGCTQSCTCMGGTVQCQNFQCPSGTYCRDSVDGNSNCAKISKGAVGGRGEGVLMAGRFRSLQCPAHSHFTACLPSCPPSCSILDGHCEKPSSKVPSSCKEGCICEPGYVLSNDKCVLRIQCGCKDAQGGLIPAGKTWLSRGCTESCNCMGGNIQCRSFQCPSGTYCRDSSDGSSNCVKITLQCPAHSRYTNCLPACPPSCDDLDGHCQGTISKIPPTCKEGCLCQPGYVLNHDKCVLQIHCGCKDAQGGLIPAGKTWISSSCTQSCTCVGGAVQCHNFNCPPGTRCQTGQDGNRNCTKITVRCPAHSRYTNCLPSCLPSCSDPEGLCGGTSPRPPSTCKEGCVCRPGFVLHKNKCLLRILCSCKDAQGALIPVNKTWISRGCTQNCTCVAGDIHCRDFQCPSGTQCKDINDGNSNCVKTALQCPAHSHHTNCLPSCIPSCSNSNDHCEATGLKGPSTCKEGCLCESGFVFHKDKCVPRIQCGCKDSQGALIPAGKTWITSGCSQTCACMGGLVQCHDFKCPSGTDCQDIEDGSSNCAEITLQCPAHSHYTSCLPSCLPSCLDPDGLCKGTSPKASSTCKKGCACQSGYVLSNDTCVPKTQCSCKDAQGNLISEGKTWVSSGCTQSCACTGGTVQCQEFKCPTGSHCQHNQDGGSSCATNALKCPAHSFYTNCLPSCLPSCSDPEGLCGTTSPKAPSTCKEGCVCRSGYVLQGDKCVLRIHCACKEAHGSLIQTGQTWISTGCTQICACKGGLFQCQSFQCPSGTYCEENEDGSNNCVSRTLKCPANSMYTSCLPSCLPSCSNPDGHCEGTSPRVPSTCKEGCVCWPGYLLSQDKCVLKDQCGCKDAKGDLILAGKTWISSGCTQSCTCTNRLVQCRNFTCPSGSHCQHSEDGSSNCAVNELEKCTIFGDPYYRTFDGFTYHFLGRMNYYLIKTVDKLPEGVEQLVTEGRNKITSKGNPTLREVTTVVYGYKIQLQEGLVVLVNNQKVAIPYNPNNHLRIILRAQRLLLITDFEMVVDFDGKHSAVISLPTTYRGLIRGLCGNYDKNQANDLMLPSGVLTSNVNDFGNSWEVKVANVLFRVPRALPEEKEKEEEEEEEEPDLLPSECSPEQTALISSTQACRVLVDPKGPFAACHQIVSPEPFEQHCISDTCTGWKTKEEEELRCRVLSGYAIICQEAGANVTGWRDQTHCAMTCPANTVYQRCMTPCPASCANFVTPKICEGPCVEGCASLPGYIYSDTQSLPVAHCGCTTNGIYYKLGDSFVTDDCSQHCTCASQGILLCEPYGCRAGESCMVANFTRGCFRDSPCLQNPCHNDGRCQEQGATFICHCDLGYGGKFCSEPRDIPTEKRLETSILVTVLPGVLVMLLVPILLPRVYIYMTTRATVARRRGEKLLRRNRQRLDATDVPEPAFRATQF
ncbi:LOW QUALITY PROTEIN: zonadhesin [Acomys russatus]|uniref:LOW QUALITY PROTEIN: zonadhesin n=1 Tax=Acomys russatus TaxID=60746 RepID=UPI0021E1FDFA|nr:LOW QUALITY PROTEIN: zonadhesin [Acomys russatus]